MDSVSIRIHTPRNSKREYIYHGEIVKGLLYNSSANTKRFKHSVDWFLYSVPIMANELALTPVDYMLKQFHFTDNDKKTDIIRGKFHMPSHHYDVGYRVDIDREFIDLSFSIPKYVYGHSVAQFVRNPHPESITWQKGFFYDQPIEQTVTHWYRMLNEVLNDFFKKTFAGVKINWFEVEIIRLDLAFNQYFRTKSEAMRVAELMCSKSSKLLRGSRGRKQYTDEVSHESMYSTGFISVQKNVYYKIYHKGTEFAKNDAKRLLKNNSFQARKKTSIESDFQMDIREYYRQMNDDSVLIKPEFPIDVSKMYKPKFYDVTALQDEADLILRHEIRYYKKTFSQIYKKKLFRKNDKAYQDKLKRFKFLDAKRQRFSRNAREEDKLSSSELKEFNSIQLILQKRHNFMMKVNEDVKLHATKQVNYIDFPDEVLDENFFDKAHFSKELFEILVRKFVSIIKDIQITEFPDWDNLKNCAERENAIIDTWNKNANWGLVPKDEKISLKGLRTAYNLIEKYGSLDVAYKDHGELTQRTYFRYRKILDKLGYGTVMDKEPLHIDTSFQTYFERMKGVGFGVKKKTYKTLFNNMNPVDRRLW